MAFRRLLISQFLFVFVLLSATAAFAETASKKEDAGASKSASPGTSGAGKAAGKRLPQVLDFSAVWCAPCKKFAPVFDKVSESYKGKVEFIHYDIENGPGKAIAEKRKISTVPTVLFLNAAGKTIYKYDQLMKEEDLIKHTEELLK